MPACTRHRARFADIEAAQREIADLKNDIRQLGKDLAKTAEAQVVSAEKSKEDLLEPQAAQAVGTHMALSV